MRVGTMIDRELADMMEKRKVDILRAGDQMEEKQGQEHQKWIQLSWCK